MQTSNKSITLIRALCAFALVASTSGCFNFSTVTTAEPVDPGTFEFTVAPNVTGFSAASFGEGDTSFTAPVLLAPTIDLWGRFGLAKDVDLGLSWTGGLQANVDVKWRFLDTDFVDIAIDPHIGGVLFDIGDIGGGFFNFGLPVLIDFPFSEMAIFTLTPKYEGAYLFASGSSDDGLDSTQHYLGASVGFQFAFEETRTFLVQPYAGLAVWVNPPDVSDITTLNFNFGVGFKFRL
jgi:hypothetical protein